MSPNIENSNNEILSKLKDLESRVLNLENKLQTYDSHQSQSIEDISEIEKSASNKSNDLEFKLGSFWFAKFGIVILSIGIISLLTIPFEQLPVFIPSVAGFIISIALISISKLFKKSFDFLSKYLFGSGLLLLYFSTLRLHYFGSVPTISNQSIIILLLYIIVLSNIVISIKRKSINLVGISLLLGYITAILSGSGYFIFIALAVLALISTYLKIKYGWEKLLPMSIVLTYLVHFLWAMNNPILGNTIKLTADISFNVVFIILYVLIFAYSNYSREKGSKESSILIATTFLNIGGGFLLSILIVLKTLPEYVVAYYLLASLIFLLISFLFWSRHQSVYSTFFYAIVGYTALSVAIIAQFQMSDSFVVLSWQSLLVVSTAIWFRSKIIIVANFGIYIILFLAFLILSKEVTLISMSFGIIALLTARILNWQRDKLNLQTEVMRNAYLVCAFFIIPYSFYMSVSSDYVIVSWLVVTILYYVIGAVLGNKKYRWMGNATLILTVFYALIVGTVELNPLFRVISFLLVGLVLILVSIIYTKYREKMKI